MNRAIWDLGGAAAELRHEFFACSVDLSRPDRGVHDVRLGSQTWPGLRALQVDLPGLAPDGGSVVDHYARGTDLVATYSETAGHPIRAQVYWRLASADATAVAIELVVSVQTHLLDSDPRLTVRSGVPGQEVLRLNCTLPSADGPSPDAADVVSRDYLGSLGCCVVRLPGGEWTYAEMVHPGDPEEGELTFPPQLDLEPGVQLRHCLFAQRLEKGVILRARIRGLFVKTAGDLAAIAEYYRTFAIADPPLTT